MKKIIMFVFTCTMLLLLSACDKTVDVSNNTMDVSNDSGKSTVNFDLNQYDSHGELSCNRIWVVKTVSDWNTAPTKYFAYLDSDGNIIYDWTPVEEAWTGYGYDDAMHPTDFVNNNAYIFNSAIRQEETKELIIIDHNGNKRYSPAHIYVDTYKRDVGYSYTIDECVTDFDNEGYAYFCGKVWWDGNTEGDYGVYWMDNTGIHMFNAQLRKTKDMLDGIKRMDEYFFIPDGATLFNEQGDPIIDFGKTLGIRPYSIEIINKEYIEAVFDGADDKTYVCVIDFEGNFIKSPVLKSKYVR